MSDADDTATGDVGVVVVAAGSGSRLGADVPKAFVQLRGRTLLDHTVATVLCLSRVRAVVVVVPRSHRHPESWMPPAPLWVGEPRVRIIAGGAERTDSVRAGLAELGPNCRIVLVHDAARALTPLSVFDRVMAAVREGDAGAVPGLPVVDTIKSVDLDGFITGTPDREGLRAVQTPQAFRAEVLRAAYDTGGAATDDAALVELCGHRVRVVPGDPRAFKITTAQDLERARQLADTGLSAPRQR